MADDDFKFDAAMMGRLSGALAFIVGADHAATKALKPRPKRALKKTSRQRARNFSA